MADQHDIQVDIDTRGMVTVLRGRSTPANNAVFAFSMDSQQIVHIMLNDSRLVIERNLLRSIVECYLWIDQTYLIVTPDPVRDHVDFFFQPPGGIVYRMDINAADIRDFLRQTDECALSRE